MSKEIVLTKVKCPKCKSANINLIEVWSGATITWEVADGKFDRNYGNLESGDPYKVEAKCSNCGHQWRVRGAIQITDIIDVTTNQSKEG
jgi:predicted nucleic-acid-binding Zn-ribbon protein